MAQHASAVPGWPQVWLQLAHVVAQGAATAHHAHVKVVGEVEMLKDASTPSQCPAVARPGAALSRRHARAATALARRHRLDGVVAVRCAGNEANRHDVLGESCLRHQRTRVDRVALDHRPRVGRVHQAAAQREGIAAD